MESDTTTLAFLLNMHRSGSSFTASAFQELGMSLGPFPLLGADSSNIHGHYESLPFQILNRKVQEFALGFPDDVPMSEEVLTRFLDGKGIWPEGRRDPRMNFSTRAGGSLPGWSDRAGSRGSKTHGPCSPGRSGGRSCGSSIRFGSLSSPCSARRTRSP